MLKPLMGDIDLTFYQKHISGGSNEQILRDLFPSWTKEQCKEWADKKEAIFRERASSGGLDCVEGFRDFLSFISCEGKWTFKNEKGEEIPIIPVVVTNAPIENSVFMLEALKFHQVEHQASSSEGQSPHRCFPPFKDVFIVDERGCRGKPYPDPYANAMKENGLTPERCIAFEDSRSGVTAASNAQVQTVIGIRTTHTDEQLKEVGAKRTVKNWKEMMAYGSSVESLIKALLSLEHEIKD
ncbi:putative hydrolase [Monocercomonoides exilis]|uniref:putative hydrolase n=1 Tax=Monocercomonoides exilis TaxID=2049356 RepID=UPI00355A18E8|nr:putative hydrolase [Monocercomonoides exilis]|eukprot:MONOS_134.1-p1 / transcript=MONOS_134.1 / gene=MONOS_134 / organism=Monocercomonoides_exilis_PA203 / gene_product=hydrolase / transcript_product=hydrolase / location=Mono_scaffold00002:265467-266186(-) / protein_length=239 / sequence_SO=supercontig / SO=protein_coding / is_pseudo=false